MGFCYLCRMEMPHASLEYALECDARDPLHPFRDRFHLPAGPDGQTAIYFCGNSLGLQPRSAREHVLAELEDWATLGVEGHVHARHPWMPYHEFLTPAMARLVGALPHEVVVMNSLTVNLHLLMVSFYRPTPQRRKILVEHSPFPSDRYAVASQIAFHGYDPDTDLIELKPRPGTDHIEPGDIRAVLEEQGPQIALILIGGVNYYTGQAYDLAAITRWGHQQGCLVGFDLAHAAGNLSLRLHEDGPDFAAWCSYKYLNSGPGSLSGIFVHERHADDPALPRFSGWWGHDKQSRFRMPDRFVPMRGAEGWQLSNPPILPMAAMRASLEIFEEAGMEALTRKSKLLTGYLETLLHPSGYDRVRIITPSDPDQRGCQLSLRVEGGDRRLFERLSRAGIIADWREPDVIRIAPVPLYNTFSEAWHFAQRLRQALA